MRPPGVRWAFAGRARELVPALRSAGEHRLARLPRVLPAVSAAGSQAAGRGHVTIETKGRGSRVRLRVRGRRAALGGTGAGASVLEAATGAAAHLGRAAATARESCRSQARRAVRVRG